MTWFWLTVACDWLTAACVWVTVASAEANVAAAESTAILAASRSLCGSNCLAASSLARVYFCCASVSITFERSRSLCDLARLARVCCRLARACCICASNSDGSSLAMTWPFLTIELKSAPRYEMLPDTWLPTCTVVTACSVPDAPTVSMMSPRAIGAVIT